MRPIGERCGGRRALRAATLAAVVAGSAPLAADWMTVDAGRGPVWVRVPAGVDPEHPAPLLVLLHGFGASGLGEELYLQIGSRVEAAGLLYALPDGTLNPVGRRFWNATDACCDTFGTGVDDSGYLRSLVETIDAALGVDERRVFFFGHSNGGFMAYRMACDHADLVSGAIVLAGATYADPAACAPSRPVRTLQIHGTEDASIPYEGGEIMAPFPGALASVEIWAGYDGCTAATTEEPSFDADESVAGEETTVLRFATGCRGPGAELWSIVGGEHIPPFTDLFRDRLVSWLLTAASALFSDGFESGDLRAWSSAGP